MSDPSTDNLPGVDVDASLVARGLTLELARFRELMRAGKIRSLCERGTGPDDGHYRLTFYYGAQRYRVVTDATGRELPMAGNDDA